MHVWSRYILIIYKLVLWRNMLHFCIDFITFCFQTRICHMLHPIVLLEHIQKNCNSCFIYTPPITIAWCTHTPLVLMIIFSWSIDPFIFAKNTNLTIHFVASAFHKPLVLMIVISSWNVDPFIFAKNTNLIIHVVASAFLCWHVLCDTQRIFSQMLFWIGSSYYVRILIKYSSPWLP
jgi:hypothetical protein